MSPSPTRAAARVALLYLLGAGGWLLLAAPLLGRSGGPVGPGLGSRLPELALVLVTGGVLFGALRLHLGRRQRAEESLQRERDQAQRYLDIAGVMLLVLDRDGRIARINRRGCQILGYEAESELVGADWFTTCLPASHRVAVRQVFDRIVTGEVAPDEHHENEVLTRSGGTRVVTFRNAVLRGADGRVSGTLSSGEDVTELRHEQLRLAAVQRVRESVWRMVSVADLPQVLESLATSLRHLAVPFQDCNVNLILPGEPPRLCAYWLGADDAWSRHESPAAASVLPRIRAGGVPAYRRDLEQDDAAGEKAHIEALFGHPVRAVVDVPFAYGTVAVNSPVAGAFTEGHVAALQELAQVLEEGFRRLDDLEAVDAERRQTERGLRLNLALQRVRSQVLEMEREEDWAGVVAVFGQELSGLVEFSACGINIIDRGRGSFTAYGVERGGLFERGSADYLPGPLLRVLETGRPYYRRNRAEMVAAGDTVLAVRASVIDVPFRGGTVALNSTVEDAFGEADVRILEQFAQVLSESYRRLEDLRRLAARETQLLQAQKMEAIGRLAGGVAHDFNNLLTVIGGHAQLLCQDLPADAPAQASAAEIVEAGDRAAGLVRRLLAFSRKQVLRPEVIDLNRVVTDLHRMLGRLIGEHIELRLRLAPDVGAVFADPGQIEQVLMNLAVNARDAMPEGGVLTVETANTPPGEEGEPGPWVRLTVSDTGVGMDPETQAHLFEPFFTTKEPGKGTGLGLAMVYGVVEQTGGYIRVHSEPGTGSRFDVFLPRRGEPADDRRSPARGGAREPGGHETILVVEDDEGVRQLAARILRGLGYAVLEARRGDEALELLSRAETAVDLVLTDVVMPGMSGVALAAQLRRLRPSVRIAFMSGYAEHAALPKELAEQRPVMIEKPFEPGALARHVRHALDLGGA